MAKILYIRPPGMTANGVAAYAETFLAAFDRYGCGRHEFIDCSEAFVQGGCYDRRAAGDLKRRIREITTRLAGAGGANLFWAEIGLCDFVEFHALLELKNRLPATPSIVTLHDPPRTVVNLNPAFYPDQDRLAVRVARRAYNALPGRLIEKRFFEQGHNYVVLSRKGKEALERKLAHYGRQGDRVHVVPHINYRDICETAVFTGGCGLRLGFLGSIAREKGVDILLRALKLLLERDALKGVEVSIVGEPLFAKDISYHESLGDFVRTAGLDRCVRFCGRLPDAGLPGFFSDMDILVLPYRASDSGSASGPLMWARSFGIPVIASSTRNTPEMIAHMRDGLLFEPGDHTALADCIAKVADDPALLSSMSEAARVRREESSWEKTVAALNRIIEDIV